jgi:uncharacterized protein
MSFLRVVNQTRQTELGRRVRMAESVASRLRGFLFRPSPAVGEGLFLAPCKGVHMYGMKFPLDVLFIDQAGTVLAVHEGLAPGRRTPVYSQASYGLELPCGAVSATGTVVGDRLSWSPANASEAGRDPVIVARKWENGGSG